MNYQERIIREWKDKGYNVIKLIRINKSGYPDLLCLRNGTATFIECKEEKDTLKPLQKKRIDELRQNGFNAFATQNKKGIIY